LTDSIFAAWSYLLGWQILQANPYQFAEYVDCPDKSRDESLLIGDDSIRSKATRDTSDLQLL
jgi:hypothetical protein